MIRKPTAPRSKPKRQVNQRRTGTGTRTPTTGTSTGAKARFSPRGPKPFGTSTARTGRASRTGRDGFAARAAKPTPKQAPKPKVALAKAEDPAAFPREPRTPTPPPVLSARDTRALRARAHDLQPIVQVGQAGVSPSVVRAVNGALRDHELIKVRLYEPENKQAMAAEIAQATRSALCGLIGHTLILYRPRPKPKTTSGVARSSIGRNQPKPRRPAAHER